MKTNVNSRELTTFGLGAPIQNLHEPQSISALSELLKELQTAPRVLGAGSNIILPDQAFLEPVIKLGSAFSKIVSFRNQKELDVALLSADEFQLSGEEAELLVFGSASLMGLSRKVSQAGYAGLEFAAGIPASLGGAVKMNAGAHGSCIGNIVERIFTLRFDGTSREYARKDLPFTYRHSGVPEDEIIIAAALRFKRGDAAEIMNERQRCLDYRKKTQPLTLPSSGSVFRNPSEEKAAGQLLEAAGFKGLTKGGVQFSELHANWLVRIGEQARAKDAIELMREAQNRVQQEFGIQLTPEIVVW